MIGIVLVTHGKLADEFRSATEHVVGAQKQFETVCIGPSDDMESRRKEIIEKVKAVDSGSGVAIFTDMFGGTPSNLSISVMSEGNIEVVAGMNLPMLIKFAGLRDKQPLLEACQQSQEAARKYINVASALLAKDHNHKTKATA